MYMYLLLKHSIENFIQLLLGTKEVEREKDREGEREWERVRERERERER